MAEPDSIQNLVDELTFLRQELIVFRETLDELRLDSTNVLRSLAHELVANCACSPNFSNQGDIGHSSYGPASSANIAGERTMAGSGEGDNSRSVDLK